jgi:putative PEP-CTERM system TPR-repeat lipoprotein
MNTKYFIILTTLLILTKPACAQMTQETLYEKAQEVFSAQKYREAEIHLKNLIKNNPSHLPARVLMAEIKLAEGNGEAAEIDLNIAKKMGADKARIDLLLASSYLLQNRYNDVLASLFPTQYDDSNSAQMHVLIGKAHLGLRQLTLSQASFRQALTINQSDRNAKLGLAQVLFNLLQFHEAEIYVNEVLSNFAPPVTAWLLKASINQNLGKNDNALVALDEALKVNKNSHQAFIMRASLYIELKNYELAEKDIDQALEIHPFEPTAEFIKAIISAHQGNQIDSQNIVNRVSQVLSQLPEEILRANPNYYYLASIVLFNQKSYLLAREQIDKFLSISPKNIKAMQLAASIEMFLGEYNVASAILRKANMQDEKNPRTLSLLGLASFELKQFAKANFYFKQVKELIPHASYADTQLAQSYIALGKHSLAIESLLYGDDVNENELLISFLLVEAYIKSGKFSEAVTVAQNMVQKKPQNVNLIHHLGFVYKIANNYSAARQQFEKALSLDNEHIKSIVSLAELDSTTGNLNSAVQRLETAIKKYPDDATIISTLANVYLRLRRFDQAVGLFEKAQRSSPSDKNALKQLAYAYIKVKREDDAIILVNQFLLSEEKTSDLYILLGQLHLRKKQAKKAAQSLQNALKHGGDKGETHRLLAESHLLQNNVEYAINEYEKSIAWDPTSLKPFIALAELHLARKAPELALITVKKYKSNAEMPTKLLMLLAKIHTAMQKFDESIHLYQKIITDTDLDIAIVGLSTAYQHINNEKAAITLLTNKLAQRPGNLLLNAALADIYMNNRQWQAAELLYDVLVTKFGSHPAILNNAAHVALKMEDFEKAEKLVTLSLMKAQDQPDSLDTLGWVYYKTGNFEKALPLFRKALALDYSRVVIKYHLALTLKALHRDREAINFMIEVNESSSIFSEKNKLKQLVDDWIVNLDNK